MCWHCTNSSGTGRLINGRFQGTACFVCWRPDRTSESCRIDQVKLLAPIGLSEVLFA